MSMAEDILVSILADTASYLLIGGFIAFGTFCTILYRCTHKTARKISNLEKAFLVVIETSEEQTKRDHPDYNGNLLEKAKKIMTDN